jgi:hypothetical protein
MRLCTLHLFGRHEYHRHHLTLEDAARANSGVGKSVLDPAKLRKWELFCSTKLSNFVIKRDSSKRSVCAGIKGGEGFDSTSPKAKMDSIRA